MSKKEKEKKTDLFAVESVTPSTLLPWRKFWRLLHAPF